MRVLHVVERMDPSYGGPCQGIRNAIPEFKKSGILNEVLCFDDPTAPFLDDVAFTIHPIGPVKGPWRYCEKLNSWLNENLHKYNRVIIHGLWLYYGFAVHKAIRQLRKKGGNATPKLFVMAHGMLDPYFQKAKSRRLKALRNWIYWKAIESRIINHANGILFTCEEELLLARKTFKPYNPTREINIGYGVQEPPVYATSMKEAFLRKCKGLDNEPYFLFISRIHEKKGVDILLKAYAVLIENKKSNIPKLVIAGPGLDTPYGKKVKQLVDHNPLLKASVQFIGMITGDAKWGAFYGCETFVLPSHQENFGIAVAEALACGKPVLISNKINIWREIEVAGGGMVADDTLEATTLLLDKWCGLSKEIKHQYNKQAYECYQKHFAVAPATQQFLEAIR